MIKFQVIEAPSRFKTWYEHTGKWRTVASFYWELEDDIREKLDSLGIPYQIDNDYRIEERGFNLWVKKENHLEVTIICQRIEGRNEEEIHDFVNRYH